MGIAFMVPSGIHRPNEIEFVDNDTAGIRHESSSYKL